MHKSRAVRAVAGAVLPTCLLVSTSVHGADFYSGKTITIIVSSDAGGGYDGYARLLARYLPKYIPGAPGVVVQDEPGGGGLRGAQQIYATVEKDGTKIGSLRASNMLDAVLNVRGGEIDPNRYEWLGNIASDSDVCSFWRTAQIRSLEDLKKDQVLVGASGTGSFGYSFPSALNYVLHTKMKIITGYKGIGDRVLAMQQGELQGACGIFASTLTSLYPQLLASGDLVPLTQNGLHPYPALPGVPLTLSMAMSENQRRILTSIFSQTDMAFPYAAPPGTPKDRVEILKTAFMEALANPALKTEAAQAKMIVGPMSGPDVAKIVVAMSSLSPELKAEVRAAIGD
jgi:tripartite-type tricarboxylate transporter receptor subunit TctC